MNLPTQDQVNTAVRHLVSFAGGAVVMFGLGTKINPDTVTAIITTSGALVNNVITLAGLVSPIVMALIASRSASPASQAASVAAHGGVVVTTPAIAAAVPSPNVVSQTDVKVVPK